MSSSAILSKEEPDKYTDTERMTLNDYIHRCTSAVEYLENPNITTKQATDMEAKFGTYNNLLAKDIKFPNPRSPEAQVMSAKGNVLTSNSIPRMSQQWIDAYMDMKTFSTRLASLVQDPNNAEMRTYLTESSDLLRKYQNIKVEDRTALDDTIMMMSGAEEIYWGRRLAGTR